MSFLLFMESGGSLLTSEVKLLKLLYFRAIAFGEANTYTCFFSFFHELFHINC